MADICDLADEHMERENALALRVRRKPEGRLADGTCHNCDDPVAVSVKYCCAECRDDHAKVMRFAAQLPERE